MPDSEISSSTIDSVPESRDAERPARRRPLRRRLYSAFRWLHVYVSMVSFLVLLFFAVTGITLNHPEWTFGTSETFDSFAGDLPAEWLVDGEVDWLAVTEHFRGTYGVKGAVADYRIDEFEGSVAFRAPGYYADAFFDPDTGGYDLSITQLGAVGVLNELHRGADDGAAWSWVIDLSGAFLALMALTGLGLLLYLKKFRPTGLVVMGVGSAAVIVVVALLI